MLSRFEQKLKRNPLDEDKSMGFEFLGGFMSARQRIESLLTTHPVVLFMKGTQQFPMCGFSARACSILQDLGVPFHDVNILEDEELRQGIKEYGNWPTIPQLYVKNQLVGGSDIMMEMYQSGELQELLKKS